MSWPCGWPGAPGSTEHLLRLALVRLGDDSRCHGIPTSCLSDTAREWTQSRAVPSSGLWEDFACSVTGWSYLMWEAGTIPRMAKLWSSRSCSECFLWPRSCVGMEMVQVTMTRSHWARCLQSHTWVPGLRTCPRARCPAGDYDRGPFECSRDNGLPFISSPFS